MQTMTAAQPAICTHEFRSICADVLSQAINGEIVGMSNFAKLTGTVDDVHERMECIEHANCERNHAAAFIAVAKKNNLPVLITSDGTYWTRVRETFGKWADKNDFIACIIMQEVILECFAVSMYNDVGKALASTAIGQLFLAISKEEEEHIEHSIEILQAELEKDHEGFINKVEKVHYDCMTILAEWSMLRPCEDHCLVCAGQCMKDNLPSIGLNIQVLRGNAMNLYMKTLDRIGIPGIKTLEWVTNLPI
ncbi:MAG: long-chain fatty aldehyde decarbonylase [Chitinophagaceae bacterium]